jgi:DNA-binding response OmpR family regulator
LTNLLSNAAKFSPTHETIHVAVTRHEQMVRVAVTDHGPGIPVEFRPRVFMKFAQADSSDTRQRGGTGLGLNICKAIIERLGGRIGFESQPHVATTFYLDMPEWQPAEVASSASPHQSEQPRILICEDDRDVATLLSLMLAHGGFATDIVPDAAKAKLFLAQHSYVAMTLDLLLPEQDGISLIRELRQQECTQRLPIVVVSAVAQQGQAELNGEAFRIVDWIDKPIDQTRLLTAVQQAASGKAPRKPFILHVEDDVDVHQVIATVLADVADIVRAGTLHEARRRLAQEHFDLLLLDVGLPDGCGLELLSSLHALTTPAIPVVIFSATDTTADTAQHVAATLVKTRSSSQELLETIRTLITPSDVTVM